MKLTWQFKDKRWKLTAGPTAILLHLDEQPGNLWIANCLTQTKAINGNVAEAKTQAVAWLEHVLGMVHQAIKEYR